VSDTDNDGRVMTWAEIKRIEPHLDALFKEARAVKDDRRKPAFCGNRVWYDLFKPRLLDLVGWDAPDARIRTMRAYDVAYDKIYDALPGCRNCC
jgi:hypothetical protein